MNQLKITQSSEDWFVLEFGYNRRFSEWIGQGIKPLSYRKWIKIKKKWAVHRKKLPLVVHFGRRFFHHVDYSDLDEQLQLWILEQIELGGWLSEGPQTALKLTPHQVLHVLPTAPKIVVKAAYKALVALYHPDRGGDADSFRAVQEAYEEICG